MHRKEKLPHLLEAVRRCIEKGCYFDTRHIYERMGERKISRTEINYVLRHGVHERQKDRYEEKYQAWNYAIRGKTIDSRELRVVVSFNEDQHLVIITSMGMRE